MSSAYSVYTQESPAKRLQPKRKPMKWLARAVAGVLGLLLLVGIVKGLKAHRETEHRLQLIAQLGKEQSPAKLREALRSGQLTRDDARQVFASRTQSRLDAYFKLPPGPKRVQYLDKSIRDLQSRRQQFAARRAQFASAKPAPDSAGAGGAVAPPNPGNRAARMESIPPEQRAMMQQFRLDMQQRMRQLGIASTR